MESLLAFVCRMFLCIFFYRTKFKWKLVCKFLLKSFNFLFHLHGATGFFSVCKNQNFLIKACKIPALLFEYSKMCMAVRSKCLRFGNWMHSLAKFSTYNLNALKFVWLLPTLKKKSTKVSRPSDLRPDRVLYNRASSIRHTHIHTIYSFTKLLPY